MTGAMITTMHADVIVYTLDNRIHPEKLSTMTGSLLDLGEVIAEETLQKECQFTIVENTDGRVVSLQIDDNLMLTCIANRLGNLGLVLSYGRKTADELANIMKV